MGKAAQRLNAASSYLARIPKSLGWFDQYIVSVPDSYLYKYEDFVTGKYFPLEQYLGMSLTGAAEVPDVLKRVRRTKSYGDWRNWFTEEDVQVFKPLLSPWLGRYGYDADNWTLNQDPVIEREHCSEYFMCLVDEYRKNAINGGQAASARKQTNSVSKTNTGRIVRADPAIVAGWAIGADSDKPIRVALLVNGNEVAQTLADIPRLWLKVRGVHPTGQCGFVFSFEPGQALQIGEQVMVRPVDGDFVLENSPCVVSAPVANAG
jgi:hypothetical protein